MPSGVVRRGGPWPAQCPRSNEQKTLGPQHSWPGPAGPWPDSRRHAFPLRGTQTAPLCTGPSSHFPGLSRGREHAGRPAAILTDRKAASLRRAETEPATCQPSQGGTEGQTLPSGVSLLGDGARTNGLPLKTLSAQGSTLLQGRRALERGNRKEQKTFQLKHYWRKRPRRTGPRLCDLAFHVSADGSRQLATSRARGTSTGVWHRYVSGTRGGRVLPSAVTQHSRSCPANATRACPQPVIKAAPLRAPVGVGEGRVVRAGESH